MATVELFVAVIAAFYVAESLLFVRRGTRVFSARFGADFRPDSMNARAATGRDVGDLYLGTLWPAGASLVCEPWPVALDEQGFEARALHGIPPARALPAGDTRVSWEEVLRVAVEGRDLVVNGGRRLRFCSAAAAGWYGALFDALRAAAPAERAARLEAALEETLDEAAARARFAEALRWRSTLGLVCALFAAAVLVALPAAWRLAGWTGLQAALAVAAPCLAVLMALSWRAFGQLWGRGSGGHAFDLLQGLVSPAHAMHAYHRLTRDALSTFHPLAVARVACARPEFEGFARRVLLGLRHPCTGEALPGSVRDALERFVARAGLDPEALVAPPARESAWCSSFCPRCDQQYVHADGVCSECPGVALVPLAS